ncbi:uncharacterized protein LOC120984102, partial [Bufo bufo]|uniref:uncharacterized protein LOC120984102 n=1 Tax=Bufo bufo TaxID=8384 RepID=UPI001ABEAAA2
VLIGKVTGIIVSLDNFNLYVELHLSVGCKQVPAVNIKLMINVQLLAYLESGCSLLGTSSSPVINIVIDGNPPLGIDLKLLDALLTSVTNAVTPTVEHILNVVLLAINCPAKLFTNVQMIGDEPCNFELQQLLTENGLVTGTCCLITKEGSECSDGTVKLEDGALSVFAITNGMLKSILTLAFQHSLYTVQVPTQLLGDLVAQYGNDIYLHISIEKINDCSFTTEGAYAQITVNLDLIIKETAEPILSFSIVSQYIFTETKRT